MRPVPASLPSRTARVLGPLAVALLVAGCGSDDESSSPTPSRSTTAKTSTTAASGEAARTKEARATIDALDPKAIRARVEKLRQLTFRDAPEFTTFSTDQAAAFVKGGGSTKPTAERKRAQDAQTAVLKLTGVVPPDFSTASAGSTIGGEALRGFYDPRTTKLRLIASPQASTRASIEPIAAHELTHALQGQRLGLDLDDLPTNDPDAASAYRSVVEGDARVIETAYTKAAGLKRPKEAAGAETKKLPYALLYDTGAPYELGALFVTALVKKAGSYRLVDKAIRSDPPTTMAEIIDPERYLKGTKPDPIRLRVQPVAPKGFDKVGSFTWGFNDAVELLARSQGELKAVAKAAKGWNGGRVELWRSGDGSCPGACADRALAIVGSSWSTPAAAKAYGAAVTASLKRRGATAADGGAVTLKGGGAAAVVQDGKRLTIAWAPKPDQAAKLAEDGQR